jgi:hypothetical protein
MKVPRPFGHGPATRQRARWCGFGVLKRESSLGFVLANPWAATANQRGGTGAFSPTHGPAAIARGGCASPGGPSRARLALQKIRRNSKSPDF